MNKVTSLFYAFVLLASLLPWAAHAVSASAGPRIVHEEEEITVLDDDKEIEKHYVGKHGEEKNAIMKDAREKKRKIKVKDVQQPKLKFYGTNGKLVKEMDLSHQYSKGKLVETRRLYKKGEYDAGLTIVRRPIVSRKGNYAVMDNSTLAAAGEASVSLGKIVLYDIAGNALFEKQYPYGRGISNDHMVVADNGTVAVITSEGDEGPDNEVLFAYDKTGKELLAYPKEGERVDLTDILRISANGRYLAVRAGFETARTMFFDLEKNTSWKADKSYVVFELSDNGIVKAYYQDEIKHEPSDTVTIDLGARMKP